MKAAVVLPLTDPVSVHADPDPAPAVLAACARIAPTWPLDQFIAVNPYWEFRDQPIAAAAARLGTLSGARLLMPRAWYREQWQANRLQKQHLQRAIDISGAACTPEQLIKGLEDDAPRSLPLRLVTDRVDDHRDLQHAAAWRDVVTHQISQHCAAYFDQGQSAWFPDREGGLYASWLRRTAGDHGPRLLLGFRNFGSRVRGLPRQPAALIAAATRDLGISPEAREDYYTALLLSLNGWAAWCAWERWQARLAGRDDEHLVDLLAMRLAWEWLLWQSPERVSIEADWVAFWRDYRPTRTGSEAGDQTDWLLQGALEVAYQETLCAGLQAAPESAALPSTPAVQAVFCIDVRSEVFRRALEACGDQVQTMGFAGFFGLPVDYRPLGTEFARPQLPGLLAPRWTVTETGDAPAGDRVLARRRGQRLRWGQRWQQFRTLAGSGFSFVETGGLLYAWKLLKSSLPGTAAARPPEQAGLYPAEAKGLHLHLVNGTGAAGLEERCNLARGILGAMGLGDDFARLVLLAGHGSQSANNPHASGLDCGACGGQTGEVNARALAGLLNDGEVRRGLQDRGMVIPDTTCFVAGLHNTTTDQLTLFDTDQLPASHAADVARLRAWLDQAGVAARAERAESLGLGALAGDNRALNRVVRCRASDWAQVRPEWGLADNAAFVVAPRSRTRHLDLGGRVFLHDYRWQADAGFGVLELIMTAPMVVTNWINLQYYASTVDPRRYGSGNKVLHNVVGGRLGVFEGNGGDLRIGLPWQSVHDGERLRHTPLRLSVFIEAPRTAIDGVLAGHEVVRQLVENEWLYLFQIESEDGRIHQRRQQGWQKVPDT